MLKRSIKEHTSADNQLEIRKKAELKIKGKIDLQRIKIKERFGLLPPLKKEITDEDTTIKANDAINFEIASDFNLNNETKNDKNKEMIKYNPGNGKNETGIFQIEIINEDLIGRNTNFNNHNQVNQICQSEQYGFKNLSSKPALDKLQPEDLNDENDINYNNFVGFQNTVLMIPKTVF